MMKKFASFTVVASLLACVLWGCGEKSEPEPQRSKDAAQQAGAGWSKEQVEAFKKAHDEARAGQDNK